MLKVAAYVQSFLLRLDEEKGQTMAEYGVILAVITLGIVGALGLLSGDIQKALSSVASNL